MKCPSFTMQAKSLTGRKLYAPLFGVQLLMIIIFFCVADYDEGPHGVIRGFEDIHVMIFLGFGFLMTFLKRYCYSALGVTFFIAALCIQWGMLWQGLISHYVSEPDRSGIFISRKSLADADILTATVLISFGVIIGYVSVPQLLIIALIEIILAALNLYLFFELLGAVDVGGSIGIHTFGALFGIGLSAAFRPRHLRLSNSTEDPEKYNAPSYNSDITAMLGTLFLWVCWPSFNAALAVSMNGFNRSITNTYLSMAACTVTTFVFSACLNEKTGKFDMVHIQNATLAGGVAVGAVANMRITPGVAMLIGMVAGIISVFGYKYLTPNLNNLRIKDTCGVANLHGLPGILSGVISIYYAYMADYKDYGPDLAAVFPKRFISEDLPVDYAPVAYNDFYVDPLMLALYHNSTTPKYSPADTMDADEQALFQFVAVIGTIALASVGGFLTGMLATRIYPLKQEEFYKDEAHWALPE